MTPLATLIVEDSASDAALMVRYLNRAGFEVTHERVETALQMRAVLDAQPWDVILCDFSLPGFDAPAALATLQQSGLDIPFIIVSGSIGDETAIELMRTGAHDYLMKDNLARLAPAVQRELDSAGQRRARRVAEQRLLLAARVFESADEAIVLTDADANIVAANPAFQQITGYGEAEVLGQNPRMLKSDRQDEAFFEKMWHSLKNYGHWSGEIWNRRKDGKAIPGWLTLSAVKDGLGVATHYTGLFSDRSSITEARSQLNFLSHYDTLTGLPNRALLRDRLEHAIEEADAQHQQIALMLLGMDRLQRINDSLGHEAGDALIREMGIRLRAQLAPGDTLAYLSNGEFVMILSGVANVDAIMQTATQLEQEMARPFRLPTQQKTQQQTQQQTQGQDLSITTSIGITVYPVDGSSFSDLLKGADTALSMIRSEGRSAIRFFTAAMNARVQRRMILENRLRNATERDELLLHYQPQLSLLDGDICGVEALVRWRSKELGLISPLDFIPLAEDTGLILQIGAWIMLRACTQNKAWQDAGLPKMRVAVNVSAHQFATGALTSMVQNALVTSGLAPHYLEVELTESVIMNDTESSLAQITELRRMGVSISLDDFGTGYSSLGYLSRFTIDKLKIDQGFVRNITTDFRSAAITNASIALAHSLNISVIAEGVETEDQLDYLRKAGCDEIQGYLLSRPLPPEELASLISTKKTAIC
jgi:diguanylate cyclase (GGDEF)-like protein/PAS domain S-box-containing protein